MPTDALPPPDGPSQSGDPDRYSRQVRLGSIGEDGQTRLREARVLLVGCGALGTCSAEYLTRAGIGRLDLVDRDLVDMSNLGRQIAYTEADARESRPKAAALARHLAAVNGEVELGVHCVELDAGNASELSQGVDLILDGTDNLPTRFLLNDLALHRGVPWIYAGVVELGGLVLALSGSGGPCLRCLLGEPPPPGTLPTCDTAGVLGAAVGAVASWQACLATRLLVDEQPADVLGKLVRIEPWHLAARVTPVLPDSACPACVERRFDWLRGEANIGGVSARLCGRNAVQVRPAARSAASADLDELAERLAPLGPVERTPWCLRLDLEGVRVTIFPDYRALFDGLTDLPRARSLYARWVGE